MIIHFLPDLTSEQAAALHHAVRTDDWSDPVIEGIPFPCPMACGAMTSDAAGGPCRNCWNAL
ncbi:hypothetical protein HerbRD11066_67180 [Herbidospora sp. RD11066]